MENRIIALVAEHLLNEQFRSKKNKWPMRSVSNIEPY